MQRNALVAVHQDAGRQARLADRRAAAATSGPSTGTETGATAGMNDPLSGEPVLFGRLDVDTLEDFRLA